MNHLQAGNFSRGLRWAAASGFVSKHQERASKLPNNKKMHYFAYIFAKAGQ